MVVGKGLESLIPSKKTAGEKVSRDESVFLIDVEAIEPNPLQPRKEFDREALRELVESIRIHGLLQPLSVRKIEEETVSGTKVTYQLIAGERRWRAAKMAGVPRVPAVVRESITDRTSLELSLIENVQREDLNALERAFAFNRLLEDFGLTQQEVAARIGKSREVVANAIRLLRLPRIIQEGISRGEIQEGHARAILAVLNEEGQLRLYEQIRALGMSVRAAEDVAKVARASAGKRAAPVRDADPERAELEQQLKQTLGVSEARILRQPGKEAGTISLRFLSKGQLREVIRKICGV